MKREPMVFFVAGMVFGCVLGYMVANAGGGGASVPVSAAAAPAGGQGPRGESRSTPPALDPNEVKALESLAGRDKANADVRTQLATLLMDAEHYEEAARWWREVAALRPNDTDAIVDLGACLVNMGKAGEGLEQFDLALKQDPGHKKALYNKGVALMQTGRPREAVAIWEDLLKRHPGDPQLAGIKEQIAQVRASQKAS